MIDSFLCNRIANMICTLVLVGTTRDRKREIVLRSVALLDFQTGCDFFRGA